MLMATNVSMYMVSWKSVYEIIAPATAGCARICHTTPNVALCRRVTSDRIIERDEDLEGLRESNYWRDKSVRVYARVSYANHQ